MRYNVLYLRNIVSLIKKEVSSFSEQTAVFFFSNPEPVFN